MMRYKKIVNSLRREYFEVTGIFEFFDLYKKFSEYDCDLFMETNYLLNDLLNLKESVHGRTKREVVEISSEGIKTMKTLLKKYGVGESVFSDSEFLDLMEAFSYVLSRTVFEQMDPQKRKEAIELAKKRLKSIRESN